MKQKRLFGKAKTPWVNENIIYKIQTSIKNESKIKKK